MTEYRNFIQDYPNRCCDLINKYVIDEKENEVTLLIGLATNSIIFPFERLGPNGGGLPHPSGDGKKFERAKSKFNNKINSKEFVSQMFGGKEKVRIGKIETKSIIDNPQKLIENAKFEECDKSGNSLLAIIRNGLAHGSLFVEAAPQIDCIENLIFISEDRDKDGKPNPNEYKILVIKVDDFKTFIINWNKFLQDLNLN
jgi:hypothetical protein